MEGAGSLLDTVTQATLTSLMSIRSSHLRMSGPSSFSALEVEHKRMILKPYGTESQITCIFQGSRENPSANRGGVGVGGVGETIAAKHVPGDGHPCHDDSSSLLVEAGSNVVEIGGGICPAETFGRDNQTRVNCPLPFRPPLLPQSAIFPQIHV